MFGRNHDKTPARELIDDDKSNPSKDESPSSKVMPTIDSCRYLNHTRKENAEENAEDREHTIELFEALNNLCK